MTVNWKYVGLMSVAIVAAILLRRPLASKLPLTRTQRWGIALGAFCGAMIGAKLPFLIHAAVWQATDLAALTDGKTILCGLAGGYLGVEMAKWALEIRVKTGDSFALPIAVAVGIGRLGCFVAPCCWGVETQLPWGVNFGDGVRRHPTQLYEAAFHLLAAAGIWLLMRHGLLRGQLIKLYMLTYLAYRFVSEFIRPEARLWLGLTGYQYAAVLLAGLFAWLWWRDARTDHLSCLACDDVE